MLNQLHYLYYFAILGINTDMNLSASTELHFNLRTKTYVHIHLGIRIRFTARETCLLSVQFEICVF